MVYGYKSHWNLPQLLRTFGIEHNIWNETPEQLRQKWCDAHKTDHPEPIASYLGKLGLFLNDFVDQLAVQEHNERRAQYAQLRQQKREINNQFYSPRGRSHRQDVQSNPWEYVNRTKIQDLKF